MRTFIFVLSISLTHSLAMAQQDFAPLGASWTYNLRNVSIVDAPPDCDDYPCHLTWSSLVVTDQSIISGKQTSTLSLRDERTGAVSPTEIIYHQEGDSIFYLYDQEFYLLYDFSAEDGDTIEITVPNYENESGAASGILDSYPDIYPSQMIVQNIDSVSTSDGMRRVCNYWPVDGTLGLFDVIDGIGSTTALHGFSLTLVSTGCGGSFWCYDNGQTSYTPYGCCEIPPPPINSTSTPDDVTISIYPQPLQNTLTIQTRIDLHGHAYQILDFAGRTVGSGKVVNNKINTFDLSPAVYILRLRLGSEWISKKFVRS